MSPHAGTGPSSEPAALRRAAGRGGAGRGVAAAGLMVLLLTALGLIGHHSLPAGPMPARHAATAMPTPHQSSGSGQHATQVATHPVQGCAEYRTCSSTVPARTVLLAEPPATTVAPIAPGPAGTAPPAARPGGPWPGAPPPDLIALSISRT
ncbi:DUF6153 family protein [Kitasatospora sp. NPDC059327]|uniref:DUF6153 family protein n=1 Tax=Kitasatospora sp. NPDC059327 TaxID=3346803 RepID=UPI0036CD15FF